MTHSIYHMTHIDNLTNILKSGLLPHGNNLQKKDISDRSVNNRRAQPEPIYNKSIHSYVPFYFNPKNHMLSRRRDIQNDIVILEFHFQRLYRQGALFTNGNASKKNVQFFSDLKDLNKLDWECITTTGIYNTFEDGDTKRMSEVLIPDSVPSKYIKSIIVYSRETLNKVRCITHNVVDAYVDSYNNFYFRSKT